MIIIKDNILAEKIRSMEFDNSNKLDPIPVLLENDQVWILPKNILYEKIFNQVHDLLSGCQVLEAEVEPDLLPAEKAILEQNWTMLPDQALKSFDLIMNKLMTVKNKLIERK